jgi:hypothetical protein
MGALPHRSYAPLAAVLLVAAALQTALWARLPTISADGIIFIGIARDLADAPLETFRNQDQHPGYPAMLLASTRVVEWAGYRAWPEAWTAGGVMVCFVCGLLSVAVVWLFTRDLFDEKMATVAALVFTVLPVPRTSAVDAQSDTPHALFYLFAAWMATTGIASGSAWRLAVAGLASGAAYWIRPEGLEVALVALLFLVWHGWRAAWSWKRLTLATGALSLTALAVAAPYVLLSGKITSKQLQWFKTTPAPTYIEQLAAAPTPSAPLAPAPAAGQESPEAPVAIAPAPPPAPAPTEPRYSAPLVLSVVGAALAAFINSICQGFKFVFLPLYFLGLVTLVRRSPGAIQIALLSVLGVTHIVILLGVYVFSGYIAHRHVIPLVGLAMPFVALGIFRFGEWTSRRTHARPAYATAVVLGVSCAIVLPYTLRKLNREFLPVIAATRWVTEHSPPGSGIVCNSPYVGFYAKRPVTILGPQAHTLDEALARAPAGPRYEYVVLHVNAHAYEPQWVGQIERSYRQVLELADPWPHTRPRKVLVFQAREATPRSAARKPR